MLVSIQLSSNRAKNIEELVKNIENTASNPSLIELIVNIDEGDNECKKTLETLKNSSPVQIKYLETNIIKSFKDVWKVYNHLLKLTNPDANFLTIFSDEFRFKTHAWDEILTKYIGYYDDEIFRIRLSRHRFRNYRDSWECVFAPDSLAFYTKKWLDIVGIWCPCQGPDTWPQLVSYYLTNSRKFDHIQYNRDIAEPFIEFDGEGVGVDLQGSAAKQRIKDNVESWFETVSYEMQQQAACAAALLQAHIITFDSNKKNPLGYLSGNNKPAVFENKNIAEVSFVDDTQNKKIDFFYQHKLIYRISYKLNKWQISAINNLRKINYAYYVGDLERYWDKDFITRLNVYLRIKSHNSRFNIQKPKFFKRSKLSFLWPIVKIPLVILAFFKQDATGIN